MLPGRELIEEIEKALYDLDADEWELSEKLEEFILEKGELFLAEWHDLRNDFKEYSPREKVDMILDTIQSETYEESERLSARVEFLDQIGGEIEKLFSVDDDEDDLEY